MTKFLFVILFGMSSLIYGQNESKTNEIVIYENQLYDMSSEQIYDEMQKWRNSKDPSFLMKGGTCLAVLKERKDANEPSASLFYGLYQLNLCNAMNQRKDVVEQRQINATCNDAKSSLLIASDANDAQAMYYIGMIYKDGLGVIQSNYAAADWFVKSAKEFQKNGNREGALTSLEEALKIVPDYPSARALRNELIK